MVAILIWTLGLALAVSLLVITAAAGMTYLHFVLALSVSVLVALSAHYDAREAQSRGLLPHLLISVHVRHLGFIWTWAALTILITYGFILDWDRALLISSISGLAAVGCLGIGRILPKIGGRRAKDRTRLHIARLMTAVQLGGSGAIVLALGIAGYKLIPTDVLAKPQWAAYQVVWCTALAIVGIGATAFMHPTEPPKVGARTAPENGWAGQDRRAV